MYVTSFNTKKKFQSIGDSDFNVLNEQHTHTHAPLFCSRISIQYENYRLKPYLYRTKSFWNWSEINFTLLWLKQSDFRLICFEKTNFHRFDWIWYIALEIRLGKHLNGKINLMSVLLCVSFLFFADLKSAVEAVHIPLTHTLKHVLTSQCCQFGVVFIVVVVVDGVEFIFCVLCLTTLRFSL